MDGKKRCALAMAVVLAAALMISVSQASAAAFSMTLNGITNATWATVDNVFFNLTTNMSAVGVILKVERLANGTTMNFSTTNCTTLTTGTCWYANLTTLKETYYEPTTHINVTVFINSGLPNMTVVSPYEFSIDTIAPVVSNHTDTPTITNSTDGDVVYINLTVAENNTASCGFRMYYKAKQADSYSYVSTIAGAFDSYTSRTPDCTATVDTGNFSARGYYLFYGYVTDDASQTGYTNQNETVIAQILRADSWNVLGVLEEDNMTTKRGASFLGWAYNHSSVSYLSMFDSSTQSFTTYQMGTATNNDTSIDVGQAIYVYPSADVVLLRTNKSIASTYENITLQNSSTTGPWTLAGILFRDYKMSTLASATPYTSYISYHNMTDGYYYPYARTYGPKHFENNTLIQGDAIWIDSNATSDLTWSRRLNLAW